MAIVLHSQGVGQPIIMQDLLAKHGPYKVGRWCESPLVPDRCEFCPLDDIKPAVGFIVNNGWRYGFCEEHQQEAGEC